MSSVYEKTMKHVLAWEGGYVDHPNDPGGATNFGITRKTLAEWRGQSSIPKQDVKDLTIDEAARIYKKNYWDKIRGDDLPGSIAFLMMDAAVNSGPGNAVKALQRALGALGNPVKVDGALGPRTIHAVHTVDEEKLMIEYVVRRGVFYGGLRTFTTFGLGWARRLVSGARTAHAIFANSQKPPEPVQPTPPDTPLSTDPPPQSSPASKLPAELELTRYFFDDRGVQVYGSFFRCWDGWMTAGHVIKQMLGTAPPFAPGQKIVYPGQMDAALLGCKLPAKAPEKPLKGQKILVAGYPAGSDTPSIRYGEVYMQRPRSTDWIAMIETPAEPVVVGMSGGAVLDAETRQVIGILITRNSPADLNIDGLSDQNFDFVPLYELWTQLRTFPPAGV